MVRGRNPPAGLGKLTWTAHRRAVATVAHARWVSSNCQYASCAHGGKSGRKANFQPDGPGRERRPWATSRERSLGDRGRTRSPQWPGALYRTMNRRAPSRFPWYQRSAVHSRGSPPLTLATSRSGPRQGPGREATHPPSARGRSSQPATRTMTRGGPETSAAAHRTILQGAGSRRASATRRKPDAGSAAQTAGADTEPRRRPEASRHSANSGYDHASAGSCNKVPHS